MQYRFVGIFIPLIPNNVSCAPRDGRKLSVAQKASIMSTWYENGTYSILHKYVQYFYEGICT